MPLRRLRRRQSYYRTIPQFLYPFYNYLFALRQPASHDNITADPGSQRDLLLQGNTVLNHEDKELPQRLDNRLVGDQQGTVARFMFDPDIGRQPRPQFVLRIRKSDPRLEGSRRRIDRPVQQIELAGIRIDRTIRQHRVKIESFPFAPFSKYRLNCGISAWSIAISTAIGSSVDTEFSNVCG